MQKESKFYPSWAFVMPTSLLRVPVSLVESFFWTVVTYWVVGLSANAGRFCTPLSALTRPGLGCTGPD